MKCLDNIYTKHIKYNSPVLYQLESLRKEYEKLLKKYNEIIQIENEIEECYFETNSAIYSNESVSFIGKLNVKTDKGFYSDINSTIKLNMKGSGEIVVDIDEENKSLMFKIDEEFLSEITLMMEKLDSLTDDFNSLKEKFESQIFDNFIGIRNTADSKIDQIKHINNNFQITSSDGKSLLNIDEQLEKIYSFNKEIPFSFEKLNALKLIYDLSSPDPILNWGYTSGLTSGSYTTDKLSNAKKGLFVANLNGSVVIFIVDFETIINGRYEGYGLCQIGYDSNIGTYIRQSNARISSDKTSLTISCGYYRFNTNNFDSSNAKYKIDKIYIIE